MPGRGWPEALSSFTAPAYPIRMNALSGFPTTLEIVAKAGQFQAAGMLGNDRYLTDCSR